MLHFSKVTDIICKNLDLEQPFITECKDILDRFDKKALWHNETDVVER